MKTPSSAMDDEDEDELVPDENACEYVDDVEWRESRLSGKEFER